MTPALSLSLWMSRSMWFRFFSPWIETLERSLPERSFCDRFEGIDSHRNR